LLHVWQVDDVSGTLSAEHGIGRGKAGWLGLMRCEAGLALMGRLKRAFDPAGLLSPGRVLPAAAGAAR
jgi:FAD/FMN-containing dehydrogenase